MGIFSEAYDRRQKSVSYSRDKFEIISYQVFGTFIDAVRGSDKDVKLVGFTSAHRNEGVSTVIRILGHALCNASYISSLIIDAGIHNPTMHKTERVSVSPGLTDIIYGKISEWKKAIVPKKEETCFLLPFGILEKDTTDFFINPKINEFLVELKETFDFAIFDLPPVGIYPEIIPFLTKLDAVVFVIRAHRTRLPVAKAAVGRLKTSGVNILGGILNCKKYFIPEFLYEKL